MLGKVFFPGDGNGVLCEVYLESSSLICHERTHAGRVFRFALPQSQVSITGTDDGKIAVVNPEGQTLYCERGELEPVLKGLHLKSVQADLGTSHRRIKRGRQRMAVVWMALLIVILVLGGAALWASDWVVGRVAQSVPPEWESGLGQKLFESTTSQWKEIDDPEVTVALQAIVDRLDKARGESPYHLTVKLVREDQINAFAMPGGYIVVFSGLIEAADSPEEVAGVLAHEIQHVECRHSLKSILQRLKWSLMLTAVVGDLNSLQDLVLAKATGLLELAYDRDMEREADQKGTNLLVAAKIDPRGLARFFEHLAKEHPDSVPAWMSSHPDTRERQRYLLELADRVEIQLEPIVLNPDSELVEAEQAQAHWNRLRERLKKGASNER